MGIAKEEIFKVQLLGVAGKKKGEGKITFACGQDAFVKLDEYRALEVPLSISIEGAEPDKINGEVAKVSSSRSATSPRQFVIETPESEKVKVAELFTLVGMELDLKIEITPGTTTATLL